MPADTIPLQDLLRHIDQLANASLLLWPVPEGAAARLINVSENATYLVEAGDFRSILRIHRSAYHSRRGIEQELAWSQALAADRMVLTPPLIAGWNGALVQEGHHPDLPESRFMVMFAFAPGRQPDENEDLAGPFERLGAIAARTHIYSRGVEAHPAGAAGLGCRRRLWPGRELGRLARRAERDPRDPRGSGGRPSPDLSPP